MKKVIITILVIAICVIPTSAWVSPNGYTLTEDEKFFIEDVLNECMMTKDSAHKEADIARSLGLTDDCAYIQKRKAIWYKADDTYNYYKLFAEKFEEYPVATIVWIKLHEYGLNDYVIAGIIGNMMVECGGYTLNLDADLYSSHYYGLCMWNYKSYWEVCDMSAIKQVDFLMGNIEYTIDTYGYLYGSWMNYNSFKEVQSIYEASMVFEYAYEMDDHRATQQRINCSNIAYEYFVG